MPDAPLSQQQILDVGRALMLGNAGVMTLLILVAAAAYLCLCLRSRRQWDGFEQRWRRPHR